MKTALFAAAAVLTAIASPALAVTPVTLNATGNGTFNITVDTTGSFDDSFSFEWLTGGIAAVSAINISLAPGSNVDFGSIVLNGVSGSVDNGASLSTAFATANLVNGTNYFTVAGTGTAGATYSGTVTVQSAVPEPATWALMLLGFGLVGTGMRGRRRTLASITA